MHVALGIDHLPSSRLGPTNSPKHAREPPKGIESIVSAQEGTGHQTVGHSRSRTNPRQTNGDALPPWEIYLVYPKSVGQT